MTQEQAVWAYMKTFGSITQFEALRHCGCLRLASRIHDLNKKGDNIKKVMVKVGRAHVAQYSIQTRKAK